MKVLLIEDDHLAREVQHRLLAKHGFHVVEAVDADHALRQLNADPDVIVLDLGLPQMDGLQLLPLLRGRARGPIIVATARQSLSARIHALDLGADDYLVKPFSGAELVARINASLRRYRNRYHWPVGQQQFQRVGAISISRTARSVCLGDRSIRLTQKEFDIFALLMRMPGVVVRKEQLLGEIWGVGFTPAAGRSLESHLWSLRKKFEPANPIHTVRGLGYVIDPYGCEVVAGGFS